MIISKETRILISGTLNKRTRDKLKEEYKKLDDRKTEIYQKVKEIYKEQGDGNTYYCMESMIEELANKRGYLQVIQLLIEYYRICGQQDVLSNLAMHIFELSEETPYLVADINVSRETLQSHIYIKGVKVYGFTKNNVYYSYNNILGKSKIHNFAELFVNRKYYKTFLNLIYGKRG